jgi:pimeloyl-ACP methyl ester carboxylesterase
MNPAAATSSASGGFIEVNGARVYYAERGVGAPVLLIHGGLASSAMWAPLLGRGLSAAVPTAHRVPPTSGA